MNVIVSNKYQRLLGSLEIDVINTINGEFSVMDLINQFHNYYYNKMVIDITAIKNYQDINVLRELALNFDMSKIVILLDDSPRVNSPKYLSQLVSMGIYNFTKSIENIPFLIQHSNTYKDVAAYQHISGVNSTSTTIGTLKPGAEMEPLKLKKRVIGFRNGTEHAGATTLIYLVKKQLEDLYKVKAFEINDSDFQYFNDPDMESADFMNISSKIANNIDTDVILIDLNDGPDTMCTDVIYLIEPGIIKLNKLIRNDRKIFEKLRSKKIVLNKSILTSHDVRDFEYESGSKVFFNIPCVDDKVIDNEIIKEFLVALGFSRLSN